MQKETTRFTAQADNGDPQVIRVLTDALGAQSFEGDAPAETGIATLQTKNRSSVKRLDKGEYQIDGVTFRSSDPAAP